MSPLINGTSWSESLLIVGVAAPLAVFLSLGLLLLLGVELKEKIIARLTALTFLIATLCALPITVEMASSGWKPIHVHLGNLFSVGEYTFPITLLADSLSLPLLILTTVLCGVVGSFSSSYLHRERGFFRFFLLLHLFAFGAALAFTAGSFDLLVAGWEFVGITSVLLIAFFNERPEPVKNAIAVFNIYKSTDVGLLAGVFFLQHFVGASTAHGLFYNPGAAHGLVIAQGPATIVGLLFIFAAAGKSAQIPFSGWLPRAMEGPTPSSAIFYGAISVHLGIFLILRAEPILQASPVLPGLIVGLGLVTALHATLSSRVTTDAKTSISYAALTQLGVIFIEAGLGFEKLALVHMIGHAILRTLQFLRAPSMLHDFHQMHAAAGGHLPKGGGHYEKVLSLGTRAWLYRLALDRCHLDTLLDRLVAKPLMTIAHFLNSFDRGRNGPSADPLPRPLVSELTRGADA
jgi:NADH:ubiquinone oxidoreductase subunit 5 (subunit L)/multisubunit Na+/H+ antiporter MnhA subunit